MRVTKLSALGQGRYRVSLEDETSFVLYRGELKKLGIEEGSELSPEALSQIREEILPGRAKRRAMNLLQSRDYTAASLREKLREGGYPEDCAAAALAYVEAYGYVDDGRYARDFILSGLERKSKTRLEQDLIKKGISKELIRETFAELEEEGIEQDEEAMIKDLLRKKKYDRETATLQEKRRMCASLCQKGFHFDAINRALLLDIT